MTGTHRQPVYFIPHGGGPWPFMESGRFGGGAWEDLHAFLSGLRSQIAEKPTAILMVTAHWDDEDTVTVSTAEKPGMLFDYSGFPAHTYELKYPAPGSPEVAAKVVDTLKAAGIAVQTDDRRGYDHGTFIPLMVAFPDADIPVVQMSIRRDLDPAFHIALGNALAPLRDEGILIIGSGMSYHNMRMFGSRDENHMEVAKRFDDWLTETLNSDARDEKLVHWLDNPEARACHWPTPEHFLPVMVAAGAGGSDPVSHVFDGRILGKAYSGYRFG